MRIYLLIIFLLTSIGLFASGIWGEYSISGKVFYLKNKVCNDTIVVTRVFSDKEIKANVIVDESGTYLFNVEYEGICPSAKSEQSVKEMNDYINPKYILIEYKEKQIRIKNEWSKYRHKGLRKSLKFR